MTHTSAMKLVTIFIAVSSATAFQPTSSSVLLLRQNNLDRRETTRLDSATFWWDALPGTPKYTLNRKQKIVEATQDLEQFLEEAKASMDEANLALQDADSVLASRSSTKQAKENWSSMTVPMLKQALKDRGLAISGKKAELVGRLEAFQSEMLVDEADYNTEAVQDIAEEASAALEETVKKAKAERNVPKSAAVDDQQQQVDFSSMTVAQLKTELRTFGLAVTGKKADLIARLEESSNSAVAMPPAKEPRKGSTMDASNTPSVVMEKIDYTGHTVAQLKMELKKKGLKVGGKKAELIERLHTS